MEKSMNKVELKGNVGQDPKVVNTESGGTVIRFSLATHETYKTKVVAWSSKNMPDFNRIKKGTFIELIGKIRYIKFRNSAGEERNITEILALKIVVPLAE